MISIQPIKGNSNLIGVWYLTMLASGRADRVFTETQHDLASVIDWVNSVDYVKAAIDGDALLGIGFAEDVRRFYTKDGQVSRAKIGFGFMPNINIFQLLQAGKMIVSDAFKELDLDHMFGFTPEANKEALAYIRRVGFKLHGPIPEYNAYNGDYCGAYVSHMSRKEWNAQKNH